MQPSRVPAAATSDIGRSAGFEIRQQDGMKISRRRLFMPIPGILCRPMVVSTEGSCVQMIEIVTLHGISLSCLHDERELELAL